MSQDTSARKRSDNTTTRVAVRNKLSSKIEEQRRRETLDTEAHIRRLMKDAEAAIVGDADHGRRAEDLLEELHLYLWHDPDRPTVDGDDAPPQDVLYRFNQIHRRFVAGADIDAALWLEILVEVAKGLGIVDGYTDLTQYAPVRLETLDDAGRQSNVDVATRVGERRVAADDAAYPEDRAVEITHSSCDHILAVALPRSGKDSTITSIGMNLWREHNYSYFSILDDGRMETPMLSIPNDETAIQQNLDRMGQAPRAFDAEVFVPAMGGLPERLPANFKPFTIGIDDLTPHLILRLAGITKSDANTEQRIKQALDKTLDRTGEVTELVSRLQVYAQEMDATIEWTEVQETGGEEHVETKNVQYHMDAEDALNKTAQRLAHLAGEGLVASPSAETNIDMQSVIANQEQAAVLCCNFLPQGQEALKYTIMDLWLRLIYQARDQNSRLPRVCLEIRELKNIAPSKLADVRYKDTIKTLRQTIFFLSTQGGSRRILMLGSTQKLNDVYKPVRSNMATKILLRLGEEEIETLDRSYNFSDEQRNQLSEFSIGQGMVLAGGEAYWPIEFRGAPCGLGLGDRHWLDRYGLAWGARVRETEYDGWRAKHGDTEFWVDLRTNTVVTDADAVPEVGTWYLLPEDFEAGIAPGDIDEDAIAAALEHRREYPIAADLSLEPTGYEDRQRDLSLQQHDRDETLSDVVERHNIPDAIAPWLSKEAPTRNNLAEVCRVLDEHDDLKRQQDIAKHVDWNRSTLADHMRKEDSLEKCVTKEGQTYALTPIGKRAASVSWKTVMEEING
jgi:hypothetical protein